MSVASTVTAAIAVLQSAVTAAAPLQNASQAALAPVVTAANAALAAIDTQSASIEALIDQTALGGIHVGMDAPAMVVTFLAQTQAALDLSTLKTLRGYVARIRVNVGNAPG